jgi:drug/metabolite transporter (DMT)-like permease
MSRSGNNHPETHHSQGWVVASLVFTVFLWGGNNAGIKYLVTWWPPFFVGGTRFFLAGLIMLAWLRARGPWVSLPRDVSRVLWWRTGLSLAVYIVMFNFALRHTGAAHVVLYLGASPVWALLIEGRPAMTWKSVQCYGAAVVALCGVIVLCYPSLKGNSGGWIGEGLGIAASFLWAWHGIQCRSLRGRLGTMEITAHTMFRAGLFLVPLALVDVLTQKLPFRADLVGIQTFCILGGGVAAFAMWNNALTQWQASRVLLFSNLVPISTMIWAHFCLNEQITHTFVVAMVLILSSVIIVQTNWPRQLDGFWLPEE